MKNTQLDKLMQLQENWDSYGGIPPTYAALEAADNLTFVPYADGGLQIEFHAGGMNIEIEINPDGKVIGIFSGANLG